MKILLVSLSNKGGGAARAIDSLAKALQKRGIDIHVQIFEGTQSSYPTSFVYNDKLRIIGFRIKNRISKLIMNLFRNPSHDYRSINIFPSRLLKLINASDADIVNFHWVGGEMISIEQISKIKKPIVWTLHDEWMLKGVYHVSPEHYKPYQNERGNNLLDKFVIKRKQRSFSKQTFHFISPSVWMSKEFDKSYLDNKRNTMSVIRNIIDTDVWKAINKTEAKRELHYDPYKTHVLYIARNLTKSFFKGYIFVKQLIEMCNEDFEFHFIGTNEIIDKKNVTVHGVISNASALSLYYSAADIMLMPSLWENMPYVTIEALFCNTPVLCFDTTGPGEIIKTGINGYKAKKFNIDDYHQGLLYLKDFKPSKPLRETIPDFDPGINIQRHIDLYKSILECHVE